MVDHSERVIAVGHTEKGGTKRTLDYARFKNKEVVLIVYTSKTAEWEMDQALTEKYD